MELGRESAVEQRESASEDRAYIDCVNLKVTGLPCLVPFGVVLFRKIPGERGFVPGPVVVGG